MQTHVFAVLTLALLLLCPLSTFAQDAELQRILNNIPRTDSTKHAASPSQQGKPPVSPEDEAMQDFLEKPQDYNGVHLQGLDKLTAQRERFDATMGAVTRFGNLEIVPRACWRSPPSAQPETAALLEIWEWRPGEQPAQLFFGWMFASSPGLSSIEHPVYDITVLECIDKKEQEGEDTESDDG